MQECLEKSCFLLENFFYRVVSPPGPITGNQPVGEEADDLSLAAWGQLDRSKVCSSKASVVWPWLLLFTSTDFSAISQALLINVQDPKE